MIHRKIKTFLEKHLQDLLIFIGLGGVILSYSHQLLDYALLPKLFFLAFFCMAISIYHLIKKQYSRISPPLTPAHVSLTLFVAYAALSSIMAINKQLALLEITKKLLFLIYFIYTYSFLTNTSLERKNKLIKLINILSIASCIIVFTQLINLGSATHNKIFSINGTSGNKNLYSSFIFLCFIIGTYGFYLGSKKDKIFYYSTTLLQFSLIIILQSRAVWLAVLIYFFTYFIITNRRNGIKKPRFKSQLIFVLLFLGVLNISTFFILPKIIELGIQKTESTPKDNWVIDTRSPKERLLIWSKTYSLIKEYPFLGVGANNWQICFPQNTLPHIKRVRKANTNFQRPHNDFLWILSEYGFVGFNLYFFFIALILFQLIKNIYLYKSSLSSILLAGLCAYFCI
ncbi:MAG: O-antigen ligase family protein, partial [Bacteroidales bacterium]|nr:O-antigen ligase family protein [Bacteroidales bacterium]